MPSQAVLTDEADFEDLSDLLKIPPRQRTLAHCLEIGQLLHRIRPPGKRVPGRIKNPYRTDWAGNLLRRLAGRGIRLSESLLYRYMKLGTHPDAKFRQACRKAKRARWEDVMRLLSVSDAVLRLELIAVAEEREEDDELSARVFKEVVRHRVAAETTQASPATRVGRKAVKEAVRKLQAASRRAASQVAKKIKGKRPLLVALHELPSVNAAHVAKVQADVRRFRAAAARLDRSLERLIQPRDYDPSK
jgi:hypothetical protein